MLQAGRSADDYSLYFKDTYFQFLSFTVLHIRYTIGFMSNTYFTQEYGFYGWSVGEKWIGTNRRRPKCADDAIEVLVYLASYIGIFGKLYTICICYDMVVSGGVQTALIATVNSGVSSVTGSLVIISSKLQQFNIYKSIS